MRIGNKQKGQDGGFDIGTRIGNIRSESMTISRCAFTIIMNREERYNKNQLQHSFGKEGAMPRNDDVQGLRS